VKAYYDRRAPEYDEWYAGTGLFAARDRPGWTEELGALLEALAGLAPARTLDVGCGTGYLTRHLRGVRVGCDQSAAMLAQARAQAPGVPLVRGDALALPFADGTFDRVFVGHLYGHLLHDERRAFLTEARAVGGELVVVDAGPRGGSVRDEWQERVLRDGSRHRVYKRFFTGSSLVAELGGGRVLLEGGWFVAVSSPSEGVRRSAAPQEGFGD
jgi:demethylmenaquinone methyltransferase/2-methoxy-6-polyprenyl-1,4-benzoquinol methylase